MDLAVEAGHGEDRDQHDEDGYGDCYADSYGEGIHRLIPVSIREGDDARGPARGMRRRTQGRAGSGYGRAAAAQTAGLCGSSAPSKGATRKNSPSAS
ncbi:hypothetical protein GCM10017688_39560 [Streptomyces ramulosus]